MVVVKPSLIGLNIAFTMVGILHMKKQLLLLILLITSQSWANQPSQGSKLNKWLKQHAYTNTMSSTLFYFGFSEEKAIQASSKILTNYLESHKENAGDFFSPRFVETQLHNYGS